LALQLIGLFYLQQRLWVGEGSVVHGWHLDQMIAQQEQDNQRLLARNQLLEADVFALKNGLDAIEEKARLDLGMVKADETFFLLVE